jgi:hypothetical protein
MQFIKPLRDRIGRGEATCSVRIWTRPRVRPGGRYPLGDGAIEVDSIKRIELADITPALARESGFKGVVDLLKVANHGNGRNVYLIRFHYVPALVSEMKPSNARKTRNAKKPASTRQRTRVIRIVEALPEAAAVAHGAHLALEVRKKRFGWFLDDHHGDGRVAINCTASAEMHDILKQLAPHQFHVPKYLGNKGWIGLWLDVPDLNWSAVALALRKAYSRVAPKSLQQAVP